MTTTVVKDLHSLGAVGTYDAAVITSIIGSAAIAGAVGGVGGHLWKGMSRSDAKQFGDLIDAGEACLLVIGESTLQAAIDKASIKAEKHVERELDVDSKDLDKAVRETAKQLS